MRCDLVQGYHTGRPMPFEKLLDLITGTAGSDAREVA
jgi:EAL domain-containing protein (putative c-di-GMP-specific phosphodiesterase class I)